MRKMRIQFWWIFDFPSLLFIAWFIPWTQRDIVRAPSDWGSRRTTNRGYQPWDCRGYWVPWRGDVSCTHTLLFNFDTWWGRDSQWQRQASGEPPPGRSARPGPTCQEKGYVFGFVFTFSGIAMIFRFFVWRPSFEVSLPSSPSVKASSVVNAHNHKALMNGRDIIFMSHPFCKKTSTMKTLLLVKPINGSVTLEAPWSCYSP